MLDVVVDGAEIVDTVAEGADECIMYSPSLLLTAREPLPTASKRKF